MSNDKNGPADDSPKVHLLLLRQKMRSKQRESSASTGFTPRSEGAIREEEEEESFLANTHPPPQMRSSAVLPAQVNSGNGGLASSAVGGYASLYKKSRRKPSKEEPEDGGVVMMGSVDNIRATFSKSLNRSIKEGRNSVQPLDIPDVPAPDTVTNLNNEVTPRRRRYVSIYRKKAALGAAQQAKQPAAQQQQLLATPGEDSRDPSFGSSIDIPVRQRTTLTAKSHLSVQSDYSVRSSQSDSALVFGRKNGRHKRTGTAEMMEADVMPFRDPAQALKDTLQGLDYVTTSDDWQIKCEALGDVRRLVVYHGEVVVPVLQTILEKMEEAVKSARTGVARLAMKCLEDIAMNMGHSSAILMMLETLLRRASETNEFISTQAQSVLEKMIECTDGYALIRALEKASKLRHPGQRQQSSHMMCSAIKSADSSFPLVRTIKDAESLAAVLLGYMEDGNSKVRTAGKDATRHIAHMASQDAKLLVKEMLKQCPKRLKDTLCTLLEVDASEADNLMMSPVAPRMSVSPQGSVRSIRSNKTDGKLSPSRGRKTNGMLPNDMRLRSPLFKAEA